MNRLSTTPSNYIKKLVLLSFLCVITSLLTACGASSPKPAEDYVPENYLLKSQLISFDRSSLSAIPDNPNASLNVPTYITKVDDTYFIVDCYNNQVIYHDNLTDPLYEWQIMTNDIAMGHTLASDGLVYLIDDTENNRVLVMEKDQNENGQTIFVPTQEFLDIGNRPHYIIYDEYTDTFYVWSSQNGEMYLFRHTKDDSRMYLTEVHSIPSLSNVYVRSFTIIGDRIYFVSGNSSIIEADLYSFKIKKEYPVPPEMAGMIQITRIQDYYYITISTDVTGNQDYATMLRVKDLGDLSAGSYEDVYHYFVGGGTPYYITMIEDSWYLTEHRIPGHSIWRFQILDNEIANVTSVY
ncbi:MAG: hypothetical protein K2N15_13610 [Lachnospiraceae bacterium]|nr:hypothetical protein [Lachnospiraceae bacterium]